MGSFPPYSPQHPCFVLDNSFRELGKICSIVTWPISCETDCLRRAGACQGKGGGADECVKESSRRTLWIYLSCPRKHKSEISAAAEHELHLTRDLSTLGQGRMGPLMRKLRRRCIEEYEKTHPDPKHHSHANSLQPGSRCICHSYNTLQRELLRYLQSDLPNQSPLDKHRQRRAPRKDWL